MTSEFIEVVAKRAASLEGWDFVPRFFRWTSSRGHGYRDKFSLPKWIIDRPFAYQVYYVTHEVLHRNYHHGNAMKEAESRILETWDIVPFYNDKSPYPYQLWDINDKVFVTKNG